MFVLCCLLDIMVLFKAAARRDPLSRFDAVPTWLPWLSQPGHVLQQLTRNFFFNCRKHENGSVNVANRLMGLTRN